MKNRTTLLVSAAACFALGGARLASAADSDVLSRYFANTLIWQNQNTHAIGRLWLNADGHYFAFYNLGPQAQMPDANGPFQVQGREGTYTLRHEDAGYQLCLWPAAPRIAIGAQRQGELYAGADCYAFTPHEVGEEWHATLAAGAASYRFWFVSGR